MALMQLSDFITLEGISMIIISSIWAGINVLWDIISWPFELVGEAVLWLLNKLMVFFVHSMQHNGTLGIFLGLLFLFVIWALWKLILFLPTIGLAIILLPFLTVLAKVAGAAVMLILIYMVYIKIKRSIKSHLKVRGANA